MKSSNLLVSLGLVATVTTILPIYPLPAQEANRIKLAQVPVSAFADGVYLVVDPTDTSGRRRFEFRKVGNQITGRYFAPPLSMCIEGTIDGNTIVGRGYQRFDGFIRNRQQLNSSLIIFNGSTLRSWDSSTSGFTLKVAEEIILYRPVNNMFQAWSKYRTVNLKLDGYQRQGKLQGISPLQKKCELREYSTQRILKESELSVLKP
jgi:hypothetical protein